MRATTERRLNILSLLCQRRKETINNLVYEMNVSRSTIKNDIIALSSSYPLYTISGKGGGIFILEGYKFGMKYLTDKQLELLTRVSAELPDEKDREIIKSIITTYKNPLNK